MMTKWDTIQADVADAYVYLDEEEAIAKQEGDYDDDVISIEELNENDLTLDWNN